MRVALVLDAWEFPFNGAVTSSRRFAKALGGQGFRFSVLCADGD